MRILGIGPDLPEGAMRWALGRNPDVEQEWLPWDANDPKLSRSAVLVKARGFQPDFAVVWPMLEPLACGIADDLEEIGISTIGPKACGAKLEASKSFTYEFSRKYGIPVPDFQVFTDAGESKTELRKIVLSGEPLPVLKPDGVLGLSGVLLPETLDEALAEIDQLTQRFGPKHLHQKRVSGREFSLIILTDGKSFKLLPVTHIYKHPPGYGAFSPVPWLGPELINRALREVIEPTLKGMRELGQSYRGFLYTDLILTDDDRLYLLEHNCRLAYPETEVMLSVIVSDFADLLSATASGTLDQATLLISNRAAVGVVLMRRLAGPEPISPDLVVQGIETTRQNGCLVFVNGVSAPPERKLLQTTSRPIVVVGLGQTLAEARTNAYHGTGQIQCENLWYRHDIALNVNT